MGWAAIALGSNLAGRLGSPRANVEAAAVALGRLGTVVAVSSWRETKPVGYLDQPSFVNGAAVLRTELEPLELLEALLSMEREFGRDRLHGISKGPRTLDLDLLLYDEVELRTELLTLPHPEMHRRRFVLEPLAEIAPGMRHVWLAKTVGSLLRDLATID